MNHNPVSYSGNSVSPASSRERHYYEHSVPHVSDPGQIQNVHHYQNYHPTLTTGGFPETQGTHRIPSSVQAAGLRDRSSTENLHSYPNQGLAHPEASTSTAGPSQQHHRPNHNKPHARSATLSERTEPLHFQYDNSRPTPLLAQSTSSSHPRLSVNVPAHPTHLHPGNFHSQSPASGESAPRRRSDTALSSAPSHSSPNHLPPGRRSEAPASAVPRHENPSSSTRPPLYPLDPLVAASAEAALNPVRDALESVWNLNVGKVQEAMTKMNQDFMHLAHQGRQKNSHLMMCLAKTEAKLKSASEEIEALKNQNAVLNQGLNRAASIMTEYREEFTKLRAEKGKLEVELRVMASLCKDNPIGSRTENSQEGQSDVMSCMNSVVGAVSNTPSPESQRISHSRQPSREYPRMDSPEPSSSPQMLSGTPALKRLSSSSFSSTATRIEVLPSPILLKNLSLHPDKVMDITSPQTEVAPIPDDGHVSSPGPSSLSPGQPSRKRTRAEYDEDEATFGQAEITAREAPPASKVKTEDADAPEPHSTRDSVISVKEEGQVSMISVKTEIVERGQFITEYEEGEVIDEVEVPVEKSFSPHSRQAVVNPPAKRKSKLGISHIDLLYQTGSESMTCRMCLTRRQEASPADRRSGHAKTNVKKFSLNASWSDLITHCQTEHPKACQDLEKLNPSQIAEMKQRMPAASKFMRSG